jgi:predicted DNA-binding protein (MmcQ/YjbR family)
MDIETLTNICREFPFVTEDIKWGNDLCFMIGNKMFCVAPLSTPLKISLKVTDEEFGELSTAPGIIPAPYVARYKWILIEDTQVFNKQKWEYHIRQSYDMVKAGLPKKILAQL